MPRSARGLGDSDSLFQLAYTWIRKSTGTHLYQTHQEGAPCRVVGEFEATAESLWLARNHQLALDDTAKQRTKKMVLLLPVMFAIGLPLLMLPAMCHTLQIKTQTLKLRRHHHPILSKSKHTRIITLLSMAQAPISADANLTRQQQLINEIGSTFAQKLFELEEFQQENGHCLVPKRYQKNPPLGNWVNKQRQNYRRHIMGENTTLNEVCIRSRRMTNGITFGHCHL